MNKESYIQGLRNGDVRSLSKVISLAESRIDEDQLLALDILEACPPSGSSRRIGVSGAPGAGKSTFIDRFGMHLLSEGGAKRLAVLSIDPSSSLSGGSILGDKTRMEQLSRSDRVYIRPSASGSSLGGLARGTRMALLLCEAAGFDTVIIESVGVGQAETEISQLTDLFILLLNPGGGDELQGIKRGIVEMADILLVNKADGQRKELAERTVKDYSLAQHLLPPTETGWKPPVLSCSALEDKGMASVAGQVDAFYAHAGVDGIGVQRSEQGLYWMQKILEQRVLDRVMAQSKSLLQKAENSRLPERIAYELSKKFFD